jgi:hypothetical protein
MKVIKTLIIIALTLFTPNFAVNSANLEEEIVNTKHLIEIFEEEQRIDSINRLNAFLDTLAFKESINTWDTINVFGYVGKYQFGTAARIQVGAPKFHWREFEKEPCIWPEHEQDSAVIKLMKWNHGYLMRFFQEEGDHLKYDHLYRPIIAKRDTRWYCQGDTVYITWSGLYAASHLVGPGNVRKFLNSDGWLDKQDANDVSAFDYLKYFEDNKSKPII